MSDENEIKYGPVLAKAFCDPFDYALGLKSGEVIYSAIAWVADAPHGS
jgi:hypothetical protein